MRTELTTSRLTQVAHEKVSEVLRPGDVAVDATAGNGHDTLFLSQRVGSAGRVFAFDVQQEALESTRQRVLEQGAEGDQHIHPVLGCHSTLREVLGEHGVNEVKAVMFNLGYLPGSNREVVTSSATTVAAIEASVDMLASGGLLSVMVYTGQQGGLEELLAIEALIARDARWHSGHIEWVQYRSAHAPERAPRLFTAARR